MDGCVANEIEQKFTSILQWWNQPWKRRTGRSYRFRSVRKNTRILSLRWRKMLVPSGAEVARIDKSNRNKLPAKIAIHFLRPGLLSCRFAYKRARRMGGSKLALAIDSEVFILCNSCKEDHLCVIRHLKVKQNIPLMSRQEIIMLQILFYMIMLCKLYKLHKYAYVIGAASEEIQSVDCPFVWWSRI